MTEREENQAAFTERWRQEAQRLFAAAPENRVPPEAALRADLAGMQIYQEPLLAVAGAANPLFAELKKEGAIGPHYRTPREWLPSARTVVCYFLPFTEPVRRSNRETSFMASSAWQHGRIEGEEMNLAFRKRLAEWLRLQGYESLVPCQDPRYQVIEPRSSNWSERHAAYIAGLGTFGMSRGLITAKGIAGRFGSVITAAPLAVTERPYQDLYEYCTRCGACAARCPAGAIVPGLDLNQCKSNAACGAFLHPLKVLSAAGGDTRPPEDQGEPYPPVRKIRFGCGKCQVGVPCEGRNPAAKEPEFSKK